MYQTIEQFLKDWKHESRTTQNVMDALTDASLSQQVSPLDRTLGQLAWHIVTSIYGIVSNTGLQFEPVGTGKEESVTAEQIADGYRKTSEALMAAIQQQWNDANLMEKRNVYGMEWLNGVTLATTIRHEIHHRGQMTVLMRQAGLPVPDIYGPSRK